jgi:hypothetical protein
MMKLIDGKLVADKIKEELKLETARLIDSVRNHTWRLYWSAMIRQARLMSGIRKSLPGSRYYFFNLQDACFDQRKGTPCPC